MPRKILFLDRDGTLIVEPEDQQIDRVDKLQLMPNVIPALRQLQQAGFELVMVSNQDGLGTKRFPLPDFEVPQQLLVSILASQGVTFKDVLICPHFERDGCECRKPRVGLLLPFLRDNSLDYRNSYVIGDRDTDVQLALKIGVNAIRYLPGTDWLTIASRILAKDRIAEVTRNTRETKIRCAVNLDQSEKISIQTGIGMFDHMLEQIAKHGGFSLELQVSGDLEVDDHHTVEDVAIVLGEALAQALGDKMGIARFGFLLPMDESLAQVAIDLSGRAYSEVNCNFSREKLGELSLELVPHFFRSFSDGLKATLNIQVQGENNHHMLESMFKGLGRCLRQALIRQGTQVPSTKGVL